MSISDDEVLNLACEAVKKLHAERGENIKFPFDIIWQYIPANIEIPGSMRPHQAVRLIKKGLLAKTGGMTRASSEKRAGSITTEYCFGPELRTAIPSTHSTSVGNSLASMQTILESQGYIISTAEIANFLLAMIVSPIVILSGISGTGKSLLPRKFAQFSGAEFSSISVQPQWSDNSYLFGYVPTLSPNNFIEGRLIENIRNAIEHTNKLHIVLLDEMNLAPVEHYFSDFLSVAETRIRKDNRIITDGLPLELPAALNGEDDKYSALRGIGIPHNLRIIGTANMDETTHSFSPKVLDRAFTIEFDDPDLTAFAVRSTSIETLLPELSNIIIAESNFISVFEAQETSKNLFNHIAQILYEIQQILAPAGIKFGYRTRDAILLYLHHWNNLSLSDVLIDNAALDFCILQKILPKIYGSGEALSDALKKLSKWLSEERRIDASSDVEDKKFTGPFSRSLQKIERMIALLETDGATHYWGT